MIYDTFTKIHCFTNHSTFISMATYKSQAILCLWIAELISKAYGSWFMHL